MLKFVLTDCDGNRFKVNSPLTVVFNSEYDVPADDITIMFPYDKKITDSINLITAENNGKLVFKGTIDEIENIKNDRAVITRIKARSMAGVLLDNEAEPVTYDNVTADFIFGRHLLPFGIDDFVADSTPLWDNLKIYKGMTHWQVYENFCKNLYGSVPRITSDGVAVFNGGEFDEVLCFSDNSLGIGYYSINEDNKKYKLISKVMLKLKSFGGYVGSIENKNTDCKGITRVRLVNATADTSPVDTADKIIAHSNEDSYSVTLKCAGCLIDIMGNPCVVKDSVLGTKENLVVSKLRYVLDTDGENTSVELKRR